jgi:RNA polymerase sigma factor (sigma-70 family)
MPASAQILLHHLRRLATPAAPATDASLLEYFVRSRDEDAFAALVRRHGPLVYNVCRRLLADSATADDCFQATFLVLARRAASIQSPETLAGWLYGVARRIARKARARRPVSPLPDEHLLRPARDGDPLAALTAREVLDILDEEVHRLPSVYHLPLVYCCLEGLSQEEAAHRLGWTPGSVRGRLERGRKLLRIRLAKRGLTLSAALAAVAVARGAAGVSAALLAATVRVALTGTTSVGVTALADEAPHASVAGKAHIVLAMALVLGIVTWSAGAFLPSGEPKHAPERPVPQTERAPVRPDKDLHGEPLPAGAVARLGTTRWCLDAYGAHCMVVTPDGKRLLSANQVTGVAEWDMSTGRLLRQLPDKAEPRRACFPAAAVALSTDGRSAALGKVDGSICLLDLETGTVTKQCRGHEGPVEAAVLSADGRVLVTRSVDETLRVWDTVSGKQVRQAPIPRHRPDQIRPVELALSPDGKTLAWVGGIDERLIHVCDTASGKELHRLAKGNGPRRRIAFSPDSRLLVSTSDEGPGQIWDVQSGKLIRELRHWRKHELSVAAFTPDSKSLALTIGGEALRLLDVATGKERWQVPRRSSSTVLDVFAFSPDGMSLVVSAFPLGPAVQHYDMATGKRLPAPIEPAPDFQALTFSPDERTVYSLGADGELRSWQTATGKQETQIPLGTSKGLFAPDGQVLVAEKNRAAFLYETATGKELRRLTSAASEFPLSWAFSPDGRTLALARRNSLHFVEVATGKELAKIPNPPDMLMQIDFTPGGELLFGHPWQKYARATGPIHFWEMRTGRERRTLNLPPHWGTVALSPDGRVLAVPLEDWKGINFVEVATGRKRLTLPPPTVWPSAIGFSPDGHYFLVGDIDGPVRFYDTRSGELLERREGHRGTVTGWAFAPSGRTLATFAKDMSALVWDITELSRTRKEKPLTLAPQEVQSLWEDLADEDAEKAHRAIGKLSHAPTQALPWIKARLKPMPGADLKLIRKLIVDLGSAEFNVREAATRALRELPDVTETALREALAKQPDLEVRRRLERLLKYLEGPIADAGRLRGLRAVELLERIDSQEARRLLGTLAAGAPEARLTRDARAALDRLTRRPAAP